MIESVSLHHIPLGILINIYFSLQSNNFKCGFIFSHSFPKILTLEYILTYMNLNLSRQCEQPVEQT